MSSAGGMLVRHARNVVVLMCTVPKGRLLLGFTHDFATKEQFRSDCLSSEGKQLRISSNNLRGRFIPSWEGWWVAGGKGGGGATT